MRFLSGIGLATMLLPSGLLAQPFASDQASINKLDNNRYMEAGTCTISSIDLFGWPSNLLRRCVYTVGAGTNHRKGIVYLHSLDSQVILKWVKSACTLAQPQEVESCTLINVQGIVQASGAQFPVGGIVWEDMNGDGRFEGYLFRNGITARDGRWRNGDLGQPSEMLQHSLAISPSINGAKSGFARIYSTARAQYRKLSGDVNVATSGNLAAAKAIYWSDLVGKVTRESLTRDFNPLIDAKICSTYSNQTDHCMALARQRN